jgi:uncharacterized membrane protein HdeD (DUF308 family)
METTMNQEIRESTTWSIVLSVLMMGGGVLAILIPPIAGLTVTLVLGWLLIITGVLHLGFAWRGDRAAAIVGEVLFAVLYGAIGFYMLARPVAGLASLTFAIAVYLIAKGVLEGVIAFKLRPLPGSGWLLFDGIVSVAIAAMVAAAWPSSAAWAVGVLVGVALFSGGLARLIVSVAVRRALA